MILINLLVVLEKGDKMGCLIKMLKIICFLVLFYCLIYLLLPIFAFILGIVSAALNIDFLPLLS